jgi:hypothetical protein
MSEKKTITVRLKKAGWEVEITCEEDQLQKAIESVLSSLTTATPGTNLAPPLLDERQEAGSKKTVRGLILELWNESWFSEARSLSEVHEEIARRGYHYDKSAVSHSLTDLVKEGILSRQGDIRNYAYIQKKPPNSQPILPPQPER